MRRDRTQLAAFCVCIEKSCVTSIWHWDELQTLRSYSIYQPKLDELGSSDLVNTSKQYKAGNWCLTLVIYEGRAMAILNVSQINYSFYVLFLTEKSYTLDKHYFHLQHQSYFPVAMHTEG